MKIAVLTSRKSWFARYKDELINSLISSGHEVDSYDHHDKIGTPNDVLFILSYFRIIPDSILTQNNHNVVVHESDLPEGKGWAPLFWQILSGKNTIPIVLFEASKEMDAGDIYIKDYIVLNGTELNDEIREIQARKTIELCMEFINNIKSIQPQKQQGKVSFYNRRTPEDSELDINKSIDEQFNLLRICDNIEYPAFFYKNSEKYIIQIYKARTKRKI